MLAVIIFGAITAGATYALQELRYGHLKDQMHYLRQRRDQIGDLSLLEEADKLRRRIAGLLASPKMYLRARRMLGPLDLDRDEITAELEIIEYATTT